MIIASKPYRRCSAGYSLVEMLVVVTVVVALLAISMRGAKRSWEGQEIRASAGKLAGDLSLAALSAVKLNKPVQVRFYKYLSREVASPEAQFYAYQLLTLREGSATPQWEQLYELQKLEGTTVMSSQARFSSLLEKPQNSKPQEDSFLLTTYVFMPGLQYCAIEFRPDGSTNLDPDVTTPWSITLIPARSAESQDLPPDFKTLVIAPATGAVRVY
jgi:uncharacterized protein (TIGR02596 family)